MIRGVYNVLILIFGLGIRLASLFNNKAKKWVKGRQDLFLELKEIASSKHPIIWFHCASVGEFQQGLPVIKALQKNDPRFKILVTFFSSSGLENSNAQDVVDYVSLIPLDTLANSRKFVQIINPKMAFFVKYEFWHNHLRALKKQNVPYFFLSLTLRRGQYFFNPFLTSLKKDIAVATHLFLNKDGSGQVAKRYGFQNFTIVGDTRIDQVMKTEEVAYDDPYIDQFSKGKKTIIFGSVWKQDLNICMSFIDSAPDDYNFIIVPHEPTDRIVSEVKAATTREVTLFSERKKDTNRNSDILIVDVVGILSKIYKYASIVYIGGGFGEGIHNILEPAVFGNPIIFGPNHYNFVEAKNLIDLGAARSISSKSEFQKAINHYSDTETLEDAIQQSKSYIKNNQGATKSVLKYLRSKSFIQ